MIAKEYVKRFDEIILSDKAKTATSNNFRFLAVFSNTLKIHKKMNHGRIFYIF